MIKKIFTFALTAVFIQLTAEAQDDKIKFSAYGRALQQTNRLGEKDTLNVDNTSAGHVLVDLGIQMNPDKKTEIGAIVRLRSELGGFFGVGAQAVLRQAYLKGIIGDFLGYKVGDMHLSLSPYTLFNDFSEGSVNEARIFSDLRKDFVYYENLNLGRNTWWQQGAHADFTLGFQKVLQSVRVDGFFLRNRNATGAGIIAMPQRFHAGGRITAKQSKNLSIIYNYINLFDVGATVGTTRERRNPVNTVELYSTFMNRPGLKLGFDAEGGTSQLIFKGENVPSRNGFFFDGGLTAGLNRINLKASYRLVSQGFFSSGAQSKRVNFAGTPEVFPIYGNDPFNPYNREVTLFDLVRDPSVYNVAITDVLMPYNIMYGNAEPYGRATPNRTGVTLDGTYTDSLERVKVQLTGSFLSEASDLQKAGGLRNFLVGRAAFDLNIHKFVGFTKRVILSGGYMYEKTNRSGSAATKVDLTNHLIDAGLEVEVFKRFDLLGGMKMLSSNGNEVISSINQYNRYVLPMPVKVNQTQNMYAFGLKYRFTANTYITLQQHMFSLDNKLVSDRSYSINQWLIFFNMNF
ncbi:MAG: hypothetical protein ACK40G_08060 [Cytophagaceae bacterium]